MDKGGATYHKHFQSHQKIFQGSVCMSFPIQTGDGLYGLYAMSLQIIQTNHTNRGFVIKKIPYSRRACDFLYKPGPVCMVCMDKTYKVDRLYGLYEYLIQTVDGSYGLYGYLIQTVDGLYGLYEYLIQTVDGLYGLYEYFIQTEPWKFFDEKLEIFMIGCPTGNPSKKFPV